ncbi:alanyl-tRNA editing protein [Clostridium sp. Cult3]|uniref:alanyl-tRNA editing protein n=1 Tax=Clostridium sp. Cult3 TaxID=2079004 RepID=UPI001F003864|nr:DHHA1 domain-containing protein [Clostridium sp. Cult3]MCF6460623.1 hypothetical protein [Clostridium sp. Cult3]
MTEKVYLENPYLRQIDARIVDKKYVNNKYYIKTNKTIFYPNLAGGQPGDKGTINGVEVLDTYEEGHDIIHVVKDNVHSDKAQLSIDWENRFDYMQQHSGQHLLSSAFYKLYNGETVGFYIGKEYVYIDVDIPSISEVEIDKVEEFVNKIIFSNFQIKSYIIEKGDMDKIPVRKDPIVNSNIRIVEIDGIDFSPCCGTHLRNTGEIGLIKIRKVENYKGNIRVEFVCGNRALLDYTWKNRYIREIGNLLSTKDKDVYDRVINLYSQKESLKKENRILREELYEYKAQELLKKARLIKGVNFICYKYDDMEFREINSMVSYLNSLENYILIFGVHNKKQSNFIVSRSTNLNINMKIIHKEIAKEINIKGGGSSQTVQGACTKDELDLVLEKFYEKILNTI